VADSPAAAGHSAAADLRGVGELLSEQDLKRIETAVAAAEDPTRGEIFCVVATECSDYREVPIAWAALAALAAPAILLAGGIHVTVPDLFDRGWSSTQVGEVTQTAARMAVAGAIMLQALLFVAVATLASIPPVRRFLTPKSLKRERVRRRAQEQFFAKGLHATRERTGILIFVSTQERLAELIADEGIAAKVEPKVWEAAMARLIAGFKAKRPAEGFEQAIAMCSSILTEHFPAIPGDNPNELPDSVVLIP